MQVGLSANQMNWIQMRWTGSKGIFQDKMFIKHCSSWEKPGLSAKGFRETFAERQSRLGTDTERNRNNNNNKNLDSGVDAIHPPLKLMPGCTISFSLGDGSWEINQNSQRARGSWGWEGWGWFWVYSLLFRPFYSKAPFFLFYQSHGVFVVSRREISFQL